MILPPLHYIKYKHGAVLADDNSVNISCYLLQPQISKTVDICGAKMHGLSWTQFSTIEVAA